ncbi:hypothetical protein GCM10009795_029320 [Nocardioides hankookensis]
MKKYGEHQNAKATISSPHSTKMPRSRKKTRSDTVRGMSWTGDGEAGAEPGPAVVPAPVAVASEFETEWVTVLNFRP